MAHAATAHRADVAVARTDSDRTKLALASLLQGATERYRRAVEADDELGQIAALTDLDHLKNRARAETLREEPDLRPRLVGLRMMCDECHGEFLPHELVVGATTLCFGCAR